MKELNQLKEYADLAWEILNNDTPYQRDKKVIQSFFENPNLKFNQESIIIQLTIIDTYYSTNLSKRYYGKEDIAEKVYKLANNFEDLKILFDEFVKNPENKELIDLFSGKYGISKTGKEFGLAVSIISKYAYFITNSNFPIYDSIVSEVFPVITGETFPPNDIVDFLKAMKELSEKSKIYNYDKLDNLLWLIGKIRRGNYSLILPKEKYKKLIAPLFSDESDNEKQKSSDWDKKIMKYVSDNIENLSDVFDDKLKKLIKYSLSLNKLK